MPEIYTFGPFKLDAGLDVLSRATEPLTLGRRAAILLRLLIQQPGVPVSKDVLIEAAWPGVAVEESNLTVQITALRRALGEEPGGESWIETLPRRGYRFIGPTVTKLGASRTAMAPAELFAISGKPSIAVLPFQNLSSDPEQEYFADGIVEEIITALSRLRWLFVMARNSSFTYKGRAIDIRQAARELGVRYMLEGSVRRVADRVRVTGQLIDASTGAHLWADPFDRPLDDIFAVQDEITIAVVAAVEPNLRSAEIERVKRKQPESFDAYDLVLQVHSIATFMPDSAAKAFPCSNARCRSNRTTQWRTATPQSCIRTCSFEAACSMKTATRRFAMRTPRSPMAATTPLPWQWPGWPSDLLSTISKLRLPRSRGRWPSAPPMPRPTISAASYSPGPAKRSARSTRARERFA